MNRLTLALTLLLLPLGSIVCAAEIDRSKVPDASGSYVWLPPEVDIWTLENGISVWHVQQNHTPLISATLVIPRGVETDPISKAGRASLMVDLLDEAAGSRTALELSDEMQRLAMNFSGKAQTDAMTFSMNILAEKLDESLAVFTDIIFRPALTSQDFERRKAQRIASAIASEANLSTAAFRALGHALHGNGYLGLPRGGTKVSLKKLTLNDIETAYTDLMKPSGAVLVVVGAVDQQRLNNAIKAAGIHQWLGKRSVKGHAESVSRPLTKVEKKALHVIDFPGSAQTFVLMARHAGSESAADRHDAKVANHGFAGAFTSRVNLNLREDKGYTYGARGGYSRFKQSGRYVMYAKVKRDTTRPAIDEMRKELKDIVAEKPLTQIERDNAVNGLLKGFPGQFERGGALASKLVSLASVGRPASELRGWPQEIADVTLERARASAAKHMNVEAFVVVIAGDWSKIKDTVKDLGMPIVMRTPDGRQVVDKKID